MQNLTGERAAALLALMDVEPAGTTGMNGK